MKGYTGKIVATGCYIPKEVWDNDKLATMVETNDEWIYERTGIRRRHIASVADTTQMAIEAAKKAMEDANGFSPENIDAIIVCTITAEGPIPAIACAVQGAIGASNAFCWDLNAACSGFVYAYNTCVSFMNMGVIKNALIVSSEKLSKITNWQDRSTCILFGDGAGAVLVSAVEDNTAMYMKGDGKRSEAVVMSEDNKMIMDGQQIFKFAVKTVPDCVSKMLERLEMDKEEIDYYILHQANRRIIESVARKMGENIEKFPMNMEEYGNTSSASIPILLDELRKSSVLKEGQKLILVGFGGGLTWGAGYLTV